MFFRRLAAYALCAAAIGFDQPVRAANLTVDGSQKLQTVGGIGVNINVNSWNGGALRPALDLLVDTHGTSLIRVIRDPIAWVTDEATISSLHALDAAALAKVYETPAMRDIWNVIAYLNQKGLRGDAIMLNFMGWTPKWLGGGGGFGIESRITASKNGAWATMVASLVYYARAVKKLDFRLLGPLNEQDMNCLEGPCLSPAQYTSALQALVTELDGMGQRDVRLVGPDCAGEPDPYLAPLRGNAAVMARMDHLAIHAYGFPTSPGPVIAGHDYWLTETAALCDGCDTGSTPSGGEWPFARDTTTAVLGSLENGIAAVLVYDGYDSFYYHHNSFAYWGLLAYDNTSHAYKPRKRLFANAQIAKFVRPGAVRVHTVDTVVTLGSTIAFLHPASGALTIVGYNDVHGTAVVEGELLGLPAIATFALYQTSASSNLQRGADVAVAGNRFSVSIAPDTIFTLVGATTAAASTATGASSSTVHPAQKDAASSDGRTGMATVGSGPGPSKSCGCNASSGRVPALGAWLALLAVGRRRDRRARGRWSRPATA